KRFFRHRMQNTARSKISLQLVGFHSISAFLKVVLSGTCIPLRFLVRYAGFYGRTRLWTGGFQTIKLIIERHGKENNEEDQGAGSGRARNASSTLGTGARTGWYQYR